MKHEELVRELGELRRSFALCDKSEENIARGKRIIEIQEILKAEGVIGEVKQRKNYRKPVVKNR